MPFFAFQPALNHAGPARNCPAMAFEPEMETEIPMTVTLTETAARRVAVITAGEPATPVLRVSVEGGGCSGFQYKFDLIAKPETDDFVIEKAGAKVAIDPMSLQYMEGAEIDFVDDLLGAAFKINNPVATASCGCGTSFTI